MSNTGLVLGIFLVLLLVAVLKFAWSRSVARSQPSQKNGDGELEWDAVQGHGNSQDGGWGSSHHSASSHSDSSDSGGYGGGGDSSSD